MALMRRTPDWRPASRWWPTPRLPDWPPSWADMMEQASLAVEEYMENGDLVIRVEIPGIDPDKDVEITVSDGTLDIQAERHEEKKAEDKRGYRSEFSYGSFSRSIRLPAGVSEDDIQASYTGGILEVRAPIDGDTTEAKKIPIRKS